LHGAHRLARGAHGHHVRALELEAEREDLARVLVVLDDEHANAAEGEVAAHGHFRCKSQATRKSVSPLGRPTLPCTMVRGGTEGMAHRSNAVARAFERSALPATRLTGSVGAFAVAVGVILVWAVTGPLFHFSNTWQLVINTGTTIVTFLMVFVIQQTQNKDGLAIQLKLNELVAALEGASNRLISVEDLTSEELRVLRAHYQLLAERAKEAADTRDSHSIDEAERRHRSKTRERAR